MVLWLPAITQQWDGLKRNVLDYTGWDGNNPHWGPVDAAHRANLPSLVTFLPGSGRFLILAVSAAIPAALVLRRRSTLAMGIGLSLAFFLLLTPAFAMQYLAWAAAVVLLLDLWWGTAYNLAAGALLFIVYDRWSSGFPWNHAHAGGMLTSEANIGWIVWTILLTCIVLGIFRMWRWPADETDTCERARDGEERSSGHRPTPVAPQIPSAASGRAVGSSITNPLSLAYSLEARGASRRAPTL
ncbi:MAG TPA: hypothetical protein VN636_18980 [Acidimicrobiia bacterium]|nr:hypothetical protein [Acidimicrobiia bacterium]